MTRKRQQSSRKNLQLLSWSYFNTANIADYCINITTPADDMQSTVLLKIVRSTTGVTWTKGSHGEGRPLPEAISACVMCTHSKVTVHSVQLPFLSWRCRYSRSTCFGILYFPLYTPLFCNSFNILLSFSYSQTELKGSVTSLRSFLTFVKCSILYLFPYLPTY